MRLVWLTALCATLSSLSCVASAPTPSHTPTVPPARPCTYKEYDLRGLASNRDFVGQMENPYTTAVHAGLYYIYANPCSDVNQVVGHTAHASVFGSFVGGINPPSDILGYNNISLSTWKYLDIEDPLSGVQQILITDHTCHWNTSLSTPLPMITNITYECIQAEKMPVNIPITRTVIQDNTCQLDLTIKSQDVCLWIPPKMPCAPIVDGHRYNLSILAGLERNGVGHDDQFGYYMNVCSNVTHVLESNQDINAMIIQYNQGAQAYHATLATLTIPPVWSLIDGDPSLGIRATWISQDGQVGCPTRNTTVDFLCNMENPDGLKPEYVDRDRRTFDVVDDDNGCNVYITFKVRNACVLPPTTAPPTTPAPTTPVPTTPVPTTPVPTTAAPTTPVPTTEAPTTPVPTTEAPTTTAPTTEAPTTEPPTTSPPTTSAPTNNSTDHSTSESSSPPLALSVGAGIGGGLVLAIIIYIIVRCYCSKRQKPSRSINQMHNARDPLLDI